MNTFPGRWLPLLAAVLVSAAGLRPGQPGTAVIILLRELAGRGARLRGRTDFDWGGIRIANLLARRLPVEPWQLDRQAYEAGAARGGGPPLRGREVPASWDATLARAMRRRGHGVEEEAMADDLLADLARERSR